jgi:L-lysine cyclodeaminase
VTAPTTRILGPDAIAGVVADVGLDQLMDELIAALRSTLSSHDGEQLATFERAGFHYAKPSLGLVEWMPAMDLGRLVSVKTVGYHPTNPVERGVPSILATTALYDTSTGRLLTLCEATFLTALRTGAVSALVTDILAVPEAATLGMIGCGAQAVTQIHAVNRVRPIERVLAFDIDPDVAATLARRLPVAIPVEVVAAEQLDLLVAGADIICTATTIGIGDPPVLTDVEHRPGLHVNAVGADFPGKREVAPSLLQRALVVPDVVGQCLREGESQALTADQLGPDLVTLVREADRYRARAGELTVFDSTGWALEDLVAAELLLSHADRLGYGIAVDLQPRPNDPYDPYEGLRPGRLP